MNDSNTTHCDWDQTSGRTFFIVAYSLLFLVGLLLNGFTMKVYFCGFRQPRHSSVTVYLKNLVAADFLISLCLPLRITNLASSSLRVRLAYCNFGASAFYLNMYASILFMGYIAANRYMKIVHPQETHILQTVKASYIISAITWIFLLSMTAIYVTLSLLPQDSPPQGSTLTCTVSCEVLHSRHLDHFYKIIHACSAPIFLLVFFSLVFFYYSTCRRLSLVQQRQPASFSPKKLTKSRRNMSVLVTVFCVCFVPYHAVRLPYAFLRCTFGPVFFYLKEFTVMVSILNICLDPLIYFIFCKAFRAQFRMRKIFSRGEIRSEEAVTVRLESKNASAP